MRDYSYYDSRLGVKAILWGCALSAVLWATIAALVWGVLA